MTFFPTVSRQNDNDMFHFSDYRRAQIITCPAFGQGKIFRFLIVAQTAHFARVALAIFGKSVSVSFQKFHNALHVGLRDIWAGVMSACWLLRSSSGGPRSTPRNE